MSIDEVVEFVRQTLEVHLRLLTSFRVYLNRFRMGSGLLARKQRRSSVCAYSTFAPPCFSRQNMLFDERGQIYPKGFHPESQDMELDFSQVAWSKRRRSANGLKYVFIDFGTSSQFYSLEKRGLVVGCMAQDPTIPELSGDIPHNRFAVDVYALGNVGERKLLGVCLRISRVD